MNFIVELETGEAAGAPGRVLEIELTKDIVTQMIHFIHNAEAAMTLMETNAKGCQTGLTVELHLESVDDFYDFPDVYTHNVTGQEMTDLLQFPKIGPFIEAEFTTAGEETINFSYQCDLLSGPRLFLAVDIQDATGAYHNGVSYAATEADLQTLLSKV